jgi:hypothetical protein
MTERSRSSVLTRTTGAERITSRNWRLSPSEKASGGSPLAASDSVMMSMVARSCSSTAAFAVRTHIAKRPKFKSLVSLEHEAFDFAQI